VESAEQLLASLDTQTELPLENGAIPDLTSQFWTNQRGRKQQEDYSLILMEEGKVDSDCTKHTLQLHIYAKYKL